MTEMKVRTVRRLVIQPCPAYPEGLYAEEFIIEDCPHPDDLRFEYDAEAKTVRVYKADSAMPSDLELRRLPDRPC